MAEIVYYLKLDARFESFPAENYVDYMTNVMSVPESHCFFIPSQSIEIVCEVKGDTKNRRILEWNLRKFDKMPLNTLEIQVDRQKIEEIIAFLGDDKMQKINCKICEKCLSHFMKFSD